MIQVFFLLFGLVEGVAMFMGWYLPPPVPLMVVGGGMAVLFLFELIKGGRGRATTSLAATLLFFGLALSMRLYETWQKFDDILSPPMVMRIGLVLTVAGTVYFAFICNQWMISYHGRRGNLRKQEQEPSLKRRFEERKRQRELEKQDLPTIVLGTVQEIEKKGYYKY
ncbi:hypothetical protein CLV97_110116 [Planifilum fimeticola]|uniref:Uncharacterized protein n=1 Tax=Planifilum fimeticola TaxID=201975 RepID=A0A2T0LFE0_9BACL|nr:hypothetical protein [Planifilum fimeticola]PRX40924.1 hypothetical protein CLV97_110116 [Planifilum fimeticola]